MATIAEVLQHKVDKLTERKTWWESQADSLAGKGPTLYSLTARINKLTARIAELNANNP